MIQSIYQKSLSVLLKKPFRLWGISLLSVLLAAVASAGFVGVPAVAWAIDWAFSASMAMIFLNSYRTGLEPKTEYLFSAFKKEKFLHVVGGMAWSVLWIFLWSLIPIVGPIFGIIRAYEYRFVPYILMTREDVKATDATKISKQETMGYKSKMFWADVLVVIAVLVIALILNLFSAIPYAGLLFMLVHVLFIIACLALGTLFYGIMHAAFYVEIKTAQTNASDTAPEQDVLLPDSAEDPEQVPTEEEAPAEEAPAVQTCPVCGAENPSNAKFCTHCGHQM